MPAAPNAVPHSIEGYSVLLSRSLIALHDGKHPVIGERILSPIIRNRALRLAIRGLIARRPR